MVNHTRLDCVIASSGMMRQALAQAMHHCAYRRAFGKRLAELVPSFACILVIRAIRG